MTNKRKSNEDILIELHSMADSSTKNYLQDSSQTVLDLGTENETQEQIKKYFMHNKEKSIERASLMYDFLLNGGKL